MVNDPSALPPAAAAPARLAEAIEAAGALVWWRDLPAGAIHVNRPLAELFGLGPAPQGLSLERWAACLHADDSPHLLDVPRAGAARVEARYRRGDDSWGVLLGTVVAQRDELGRPRRLTGVAQDITEHRQMEQALRRAHERAALAARGAGLGTWELDLVTGRAQWDERMWQLRGLPPQPDALGREAQMAVVHPDDRAAVLALMTNALGAGDIAQYEFRIVWPDGVVRWLASRSVALFDERGQPVRRIGVNWDITDSRAAHRARQERELALRESRAKAEFLARMSHELRTPLNAVLGLTQLLLDDASSAAEATAMIQRQRLAHIQAAGRQLLAMVDDALELGALPGESSVATPRPVPLSPLLDELEGTLKASRHGQAVDLDRGDLSALPRADPSRLRLLLRLLLSIALRHAPASSRVVVRAQSTGERVSITIGDPGLLTSPESPADFDAGRDSEGSSLALASALAEQMEGRLRIRAAHDGVIGFAIDLPAESHGPVADTPTSKPVRGHILYIEDNAVNAMIVADLIGRRRDLQGHVAATGLQGVTMAEQLLPDLILLDMQLPDIDGFEVLRRLRARPALATTRVVALSANAMPQDIERGMAAGLADYWTKPLDFAVFNASMNALFGPETPDVGA